MTSGKAQRSGSRSGHLLGAADHADARLPHVPGLDGVRAIAVVVVVLYHAELFVGGSRLLPGGFLGVEMFFVISGYLITTLLLAEHARSGRIDLREFWRRRARRLLPALAAFLLGAITMAALFADDALPALRRDLFGAVFYVANWAQLVEDTSYFEGFGRPPFLRHLWSLAVEEQFYVVWPLLVFGGLAALGRRRLFVAIVFGAAASTALMWLLFDRLAPYADPTRIYYGTDTRAAGLLIGAAGAFVWRPWIHHQDPDRFGEGARVAIDLLGVAALAFALWVQTWMTDDVIEAARLYRGGFLLTSLPTLVVIGAVVVPRSHLARCLSTAPLQWLGTRSYGIYLWHFPVFAITRPRVDVELDGWQLLAVRLITTAILVELSYQLVERPVRERRFFATVTAAVTAPRPRLAQRTALVAVGFVAVGALVSVERLNTGSAAPVEVAAGGGAGTATDELPEGFPADDVVPSEPGAPEAGGPSAGDAAGVAGTDGAADPATGGQGDDAAAGATDGPGAGPGTTDGTSDGSGDGPGAGTGADAGDPTTGTDDGQVDGNDGGNEGGNDGGNDESATDAAGDATSDDSDAGADGAGSDESGPDASGGEPPSVPYDRFTVIGDSVILGADDELAALGAKVAMEARLGRQWWELGDEIADMVARKRIAPAVVLHLGNNGRLTDEMFDDVVEALTATGRVERIVVVTVRVPKPWETEVNGTLADAAERWPDLVVLADWFARSNGHGEFFEGDGVHLTPAGKQAMAALVAEALSAG